MLPFALIPVLHFTGDKAIMGTLKNGRVMQGVAWLLSVVIGINMFFVAEYVFLKRPDAIQCSIQEDDNTISNCMSR